MNSILSILSAGDSLSGTHLLASAVFGRDIARYHQLIEFLTWLSIILWCFVILTTLLRAGASALHSRSQRKGNKRSLRGGISGHGHGRP